MAKNKLIGKVFMVAVIFTLHLSPFTSVQAQFGDYGVKFGLGSATISDDLSTRSPILGMNVGGYVNFTFAKSKSVLAEIFYLQSGLNITRRGRTHEQVFQNSNTRSIREGYSHYYAVQLPLLAGVHLELPIREAGHVVGVYLGPAVSYGLFGFYNDRMVTPNNPDPRLNYDLNVNGSVKDRNVFSHINRLDVSAILGISYEHGPFTMSLSVDHGFITIAKEKDIVRMISNATAFSSSDKVDDEIPTGNNNAFLFTLGYKLGSFSNR